MSIDRTEILTLNQKLWDQIATQFVAGTALPKYGSFIPTEEDLKLLEGIKQWFGHFYSATFPTSLSL